MRLWLIALIMIAVLAGVFSFTVSKTSEGILPPPEDIALRASAPRVSFTSTYKNDSYTVKGTVAVPTPCHSISAQGALATGPEHIEITLSIPEDPGPCLMREDLKPFSVTVEGPKDIPLAILINGVVATSTLP